MDNQGSRTTARHRREVRGPAADSVETCDLVTVPARQGLEAVDILRRGGGRPSLRPGADGVGSVLHDGDGRTLGFLVPPGTAAGWDLPGSACTQTRHHGGRSAAPGEPPVAGACWLLPPGDAGAVTDPVVLRAALGEAARVIEAADRCS